MTAPIVGARTVEQLEDNLLALDVTLSPATLETLERATAPELGFPHDFLAMPLTRQVMGGGARIETRA